MFSSVRHFLEMIRFSHTLFALPFALLAVVMAWTTPVPAGAPAVAFSWRELLGVLLAMVTARTMAMAVNRLADRHIDGANPRTAGRHLPAGLLSVPTVGAFTLLSGLGFIAATLLFLPNWLPVALSVPVLLFLCGYSYAKRFTSLAHFWLGAALMLAPVCTWIALRGSAVLADPSDLLPALVLGGAVLLWVAGFDIIYACQDADFDKQARLHSVPARLGVAGSLRLAMICHAGMVVLLILLPVIGSLGFGPPLRLGVIYGVGLLAVAGLLVYEHALVRPDDLARVNVAFFQVNVIVSFGLFVIGSVDLLT